MNSLHYYLGDLYPSMGSYDTTGSTIPDTHDQNALVDNQKLSQEYQPSKDPEKSRSIFMSLGVVLIVVFFMSMGGR